MSMNVVNETGGGDGSREAAAPARPTHTQHGAVASIAIVTLS